MIYTNCKICKKKAEKVFTALILNKYKVSFFHCKNCKFLFSEEPYWLEEAYKLPITITDTGILQRNIYLSNFTSKIISLFYNSQANFLDYGGGYGIFVRLMRDKGFNFFWYDKYCEPLFCKGFEFKKNLMKKIELITSFETFEHFVNPLEEIENMLSISKNILFTTLLYGNSIPDPTSWWYYSFETGQHISFYNLKTLIFIAKKYNLNFYTNGTTIHLFTSKKLSNFLLKFIFKFHKIIPLKLINPKLKSKTMEDHIKLKESIKCC